MEGTCDHYLHQKYQHLHIKDLEEDNQEEGFAHLEIQAEIFPKNQHPQHIVKATSNHRTKKINLEPKLKLTFLGHRPNSRQQLQKSIINKEERNKNAKSLNLTKKDIKSISQADYISNCVVKISRTIIGQNISIPSFSIKDRNIVKSFILSTGGNLIYQRLLQNNTHGFIKALHQINNDSFVANLLNKLLKNKIKESFIMPKVTSNKTRYDIEFKAEHQSANLQFASRISANQYDLYLKNDTNTHGHQCWFNFQLINNKAECTHLTLNICNIKRELKLIHEGQKIYIRKLANKSEQPAGEWRLTGENINIKMNNNSKYTTSRLFKLSFQCDFEGNSSYQISLLPPYTYSQLLTDLTKIINLQHVLVQTLTYSLIGLAIPLLTFTNTKINPNEKKVILISCRIHPGESVGSFMAKGIIQAFVHLKQPAYRQFLDKNIVKIIPMLNPDGVILGNFRTNYLGIDLNRGFDTIDQITNPQILALKNLGSQLKEQYGDRFNIFIDLHGHSNDKNIFAYGPQNDFLENNFYQVRMLPKILNSKSKYFNYSSCSFKLQDYKKNTARGYFINHLNVTAYTIEASYAFYSSEEGKNMHFLIDDWLHFGNQLADSVAFLSKIDRFAIKSRMDLKKCLISESDKEQLEIIKRFKKQFKKEKEQTATKRAPKVREEIPIEDSDGESEKQDFNKNQREEIERRVIESSNPNLILPRVLKPTILYPTVTPKLFKVREEMEITHLKILYTKRNKYNGMRMQANNYIHSLRGIDMIKPSIKVIMPEK